jgi:hypothetical protein
MLLLNLILLIEVTFSTPTPDFNSYGFALAMVAVVAQFQTCDILTCSCEALMGWLGWILIVVFFVLPLGLFCFSAVSTFPEI